jgi:transposase
MAGHKVGRIGFTPRFDSIPLKQHKGTHNILIDQNCVTVAKGPKPFKVNGMDQLPKNKDGTLKQIEFANANLLQKDGDYYLQVFCYTNKDQEYIDEQHEINQKRKGKAIGLDFGCSTQLTGFTNENDKEGFKIQFEVPIDKITRRLDRKIARKLDKKTPKKQRKNSKNRLKDLAKRRKRLKRLSNQKKDIRNKIVACITKNYEIIVVQDENIDQWQKGGHGKKIQNTGIGGIMADLKNKSRTLILVDRFFASTKTCSACGHKKDEMKQSERIYVCPHCGAIMCRDMNAAKNILTKGLEQAKKIAREPSKSTLGENLTSMTDTIDVLRNITRVSCKSSSLNQEAPAFRQG